MPGMSPDGKDRPTSMIKMRPSSSTQAMFRPTSPTPPRKTTRQSFALEETGVLQCCADPGLLLCSRRNERQPRHPRGAPEHVQSGLHRDRVRRDEERVEQRRELLVDLACCGHVTRADQLEHL